MYKKTITYTDYNGQDRTEDFYFNFSKAELMEIGLAHPEGYEAWIQGIINANDNETLLRIFKELILKAYGEKDPTGKRFIKSKELSEAFSQTEAYSELYMEMITDANAAAEFVNAITPTIKEPAAPTLASA